MNPLESARILVVDDDPDVLKLLKDWLGLVGSHVDTAVDGLQAACLAKQNRYDLVITDLEMPHIDGLQLLSALQEIDPTLAVVFLSGKGTMDDAIHALRGGRAFDFLKKPLRDFDLLARVLKNALVRRAALAPTVTTEAQVSGQPDIVEPLSPREIEIMRLLAQGLDNRTIAVRLILSEKTVRNHLSRIYEKLQVANRTQAVLRFQQLGFIS